MRFSRVLPLITDPKIKFLSSHLTSSKLITQISSRGSAGKIAMTQACQQFVLLESLCQITVEC